MTYTASTFSGNTSNSTKLNTEFQLIETAMDIRLGRTAAGNNQMLTDIDMNNFDINNVGNLDTDTLVVGGVAVLVTGLSAPELVSTDAGSTAGPTLSLYRNSASAADADFTGEILFTGNDDAATPAKVTYAAISSQIDDSSAGTEDATLLIKTMVAGTLTTQLDISSAGLVVAGGVDSLTSATTVVSVAAATAPTSGQVLTATASTTATWQTPDATLDSFENFLSGTGAGAGLNVGEDNFFVGVDAGGDITSGSSNVAIGFETLDASTTSNNMVAIGTGSLGAKTTGFGRHVCVGVRTAESITTGDDNVMIGYETGLNLTGDSSSNVFIGFKAGPSSSTLENNQLYINNAAGTPLIGGDFSAATVLITGALTVTGGVDALTSATTTVSVAAATAPTSGQVLTATSSTTATWQTP